MPRSTEELRASIELANAATPGPWTPVGIYLSTVNAGSYGPRHLTVAEVNPSLKENHANQRLIADARNNYAADLTDLLATRAEVERLREALKFAERILIKFGDPFSGHDHEVLKTIRQGIGKEKP